MAPVDIAHLAWICMKAHVAFRSSLLWERRAGERERAGVALVAALECLHGRCPEAVFLGRPIAEVLEDARRYALVPADRVAKPYEGQERRGRQRPASKPLVCPDLIGEVTAAGVKHPVRFDD